MKITNELLKIYTKHLFEKLDKYIFDLNWDIDLTDNDREYCIDAFKEILEDIGIEIIYVGDEE